MKTITIKIDTQTKAGKALNTILEILAEQPGVEIVQKKSPYNPEFVKKVLKSRNSKKLHLIPTDQLWESI